LFDEKYLLALLVPSAVVICGALAKFIVRRSDFAADDFFLGVELTLAAVATCLTAFVEMTKVDLEHIKMISAFLTINFCLLFVIVATHKYIGHANVRTKTASNYMGYACSGLGFFLLYTSIFVTGG